MKNKMQVFQNEKFGELRTVRINGEPWFVAADVCKALEIGNPTDALRRLDEDERTLVSIEGASNGLPVNAVNEPGLYVLILGSRKPEAKAFKRWITHEVLPSIRKHGAYMTDSLLEQAANNADVAAQVAKALYEERSLNKKLAGQLALTEAQLTTALPKAAYYDALVACPNCTGVRLTAKELGVPQSMFTAYLVRKKYAYYDESGKMHPYALPYRNGLFVVREFVAKNGHNGTQMLVTPKGRQLFQTELAEIIG